MISRYRMKIDVLGQGVLIGAILLLVTFASGLQWTNFLLIVLGIWQLVSAIHLYYSYKYIKKLNFLRTALVLGLSLPIWLHLIDWLAYLPVAGLLIWYFIQTIRDTIRVYNRPRSFWDL